MAVDPRLVTIPPDEAKRVISNGLNVAELEIATLDVGDGPLVTLTVCAGAEAPEQLVWIDASVAVSPVDFHHTSPSGGAELDRNRGATHEDRPSHRPAFALVRSRTDTVAWLASSCESASLISRRSCSGQGASGSASLD